MDGIINVYKPLGMTSHAVVSRVRRILNIKKVGHTGTLDPEAEGVLPICVGRGTKASDMLINCDKQYRAVMQLGITTDTQDATGNVLMEREVCCNEMQIVEIMHLFVGEIDQIPPMYSAIKIKGQKLYELARKGIEIERKSRKILIKNIEIEKIYKNEVTLLVDCSKGTYIRTLCNDIGEALGCGGIMKSLVRTRVGDFDIDDTISIEELEQKGAKGALIPLQTIFGIYKAITLNNEQEFKVRNGVSIEMDLPDGIYRLQNIEGDILCISEAGAGVLKMLKAFYGG